MCCSVSLFCLSHCVCVSIFSSPLCILCVTIFTISISVTLCLCVCLHYLCVCLHDLCGCDVMGPEHWARDTFNGIAALTDEQATALMDGIMRWTIGHSAFGIPSMASHNASPSVLLCLTALFYILSPSHLLGICPSTSHSHTHTHSSSLVLVVMIKTKELKTQISHTHSLILALTCCFALTFTLVLTIAVIVIFCKL